MKSFLLFLIFVFLGFSDLELVKEFQVSRDSFEVDQLDRVYLWDSEGVDLLSDNGLVVGTFGNVRQGELTSVDVSNPMKIIVFYKYSGEVYLLDNQLNLHADALDLLGFVDRDINLVANSTNNHFWLYDNFGSEIIRVNQNLEIVCSTENLSSFLNKDFHPAQLIERNEFLYVLSKDVGIAVFDIFGSFLKFIPIENISNFQVINDFIVYQEMGALVYLNQKNFEENKVNVVDNTEGVIKIVGEKYLVLESGKLKIYE